MQRQSLCSILISNTDKNIKNNLLSDIISKLNLKKFKEEEKKHSVKSLTDLRDIKSKNSKEVYEILNTMVKNNQFFMYCGPLLININPGPNLVKNYLNLQSWVKETESKEENEWKPHLYSFMYYVYQTMINEKKDQIINMLGQIGSGKTFNIIHIIEYYCCMVGPENYQIDTFDIIHKSIQLIHIMGSIFRQNNLESTSCGLLLRLGFGNDNKICYFDFESKILDFTLPFSENGRSFSVLHSLVAAASSDLKKNLSIPENEIHLNFFRKFSNNFSKKTKERFKLNDFEIWNRYHLLLKFFDFNKDEVLEILQILSFMITLNDIGMTKGKINNINGYIISKGRCSKKLAKILNMDEDEFIKTMGVFKEVSDIKNTLISLMKYSYYICFEYIIQKIKNKLKIFFNQIYSSKFNITQNENTIKTNRSSRNNNSNKNSGIKLLIDKSEIKYINFLDFPGEVEDQTLGGIMTNLANECINLYAGNSYSSVVEKLTEEKIFLKLFKPLHSYQVVRALMGNNGLFNYLSNPFTQDNYYNLRKDVDDEKFYQKCIKFLESKENNNNFKFNVTFSQISVNYNYESLYLETKSLIHCHKAYKVFSISQNNIIKSTYQKVIQTKIDFFQFVQKHILSLFSPIENLSPFVVYCLHSNKSYKIFFGNDKKKINNNIPDEINWVIPKNLTKNLLEKSLCIPVLYWEWFGYHEWIDMDTFVKEFGENYRKIEMKVQLRLKKRELASNNNYSSINNKYFSTNISSHGNLSKNKISTSSLNGNNNIIEDEENWKKMNNFEKTNYILNGLFMTREALIGKNYIMLKLGTFNKIKDKINKLNEEKKEENLVRNSSNQNIKMSKQNIRSNSKSNKTNKEQSNSNLNPMNLDHKIQRKLSLKTQCHLQFIQNNENNLEKQINNMNDSTTNTLKIINIGDDANKLLSKYNLYKIIDRNNNEYLESIETKTENSNLNMINQIDDAEIENYRRKNNIIIPNKQNFDLVSGLFNFNNKTNFNIFDYSNVQPEIIIIQSAWRAFKSKQKLFLLKYVISQIIKIQSFKRGMTTRSKFNKLKECLKKVILIQKIFRKRYNKVIKNIIRIQSIYRKIKGKKRVERKLNRLQNYYKTGEDYYDSSDEERMKILENKRQNILEKEIKKKIEEERKKKRKSSVKDYTKPIKQKSLPKQKKNLKFDLTKEKKKSNIISAILLDKNLMKENEKINRLLANEKGVNKNIKYELLQITPNQRRKKNSNKRIEDTLIEYGEIIKQKKAQEKINKLKNEEMQYSFKPKVNKNNNTLLKTNYSNDFLKRVEQYEKLKEDKIEQIKTTIIDPDKDDLTFQPKVSKMSKNMKRDINDLYKWKIQKDLKLENKIKEKEEKEKEEIEKYLNVSHINNHSKNLLTKMSDKSRLNTKNKINKCSSMGNINNNCDKYLKNNNNEDDEMQIDLWPEEIEKRYYENKINNNQNNNLNEDIKQIDSYDEEEEIEQF